jgi:hypothetical protein
MKLNYCRSFCINTSDQEFNKRSMKKYLSFVFLFATGLSYCQTIIPKAGISISNVSTSSIESGFISIKPKSTIGFTGGIGINFPINDKFSVQPELLFTQKGSRIKQETSFSIFGSSAFFKADAKATISYLEIPVLAKVTFGDDLKYYINAGPSVSIGLGGKYSYEFTVSDGSNPPETEKDSGSIKFGESSDPDQSIGYIKKRVDIGIQIGGGVIIAQKLIIDLRYGMGFTNINSDSSDSGKAQNRSFQITVGMPIKLK